MIALRLFVSRVGLPYNRVARLALPGYPTG